MRGAGAGPRASEGVGGLEGHFDLDQEVWDGDHKLPDGGGLLTGQELVDQAMANDAPPEKNLDGATEGWFGDSISGKTKETGAGLATGTARSKFSIVDLPGMGEAGAVIPHGEALAASDADGVDGPQGPKTPAEGGLAGFTEKQINVLADAVQKAKENTPVGETVTLKYEGAIVTVKGEKEVDGEGGMTKDYVDGETGELYEPTEGQQQYMGIQTAAKLGSEMNPVRTDDLLTSDPLPDVGDDVNAPMTPEEWEELHSYDGSIDVADTIPDGGVIDPVEFEG